jgi:hypothetical protein
MTKEEVLKKIVEVKEQIKDNKWSEECIDLFLQGFAVGSNFEHSYYQDLYGNNYDSLQFWGYLSNNYGSKETK